MIASRKDLLQKILLRSMELSAIVSVSIEKAKTEMIMMMKFISRERRNLLPKAMVKAAITAIRAKIPTVINTQPINHIALRELLEETNSPTNQSSDKQYLTVTGVTGRAIVAQIRGEMIPSFPSD